MTGILDRIRNTTVADLEGVRSDFDDLPRGHFRAAKDTGMTRIVEGADDLTPPRRIKRNAGLITVAPVVDSVTGETEHGNGDTCNNPKCCPQEGPVDARSPRQREYMDNLITWLAEHDADAAAKARTYTDGMTERGLWVAGKDTNTSDWITRLKNKLAAAKAAPKAAPVVTALAKPAFDAYDDIPTGYYALVEDEANDIIKFYRVNHHKSGRLYVDACASDERHPVRVWATRKAILDGIRAMGWKASTALYGSKIGSCGRCHRTLTDAESRARGIGPDCWGKM